ncbi:hypothetical protein ACFFHJ_25180 [Planotetraspora thailandica]|uniref:MmyB family transcriptional regulator n=1 Tax=Planotetraspora thailandica TaxID=487172 RepID=UPI0023B24C0F|nr:hypothetical protein [Planotetraspora thailandica]
MHPLIGPIELECETLFTADADQRLVVFTAPPGTDHVTHLGLLRVLGSERFGIVTAAGDR